MDSVLALVCHKEDCLTLRIGLQESFANLKTSICSSWCEFSPPSMEIFHMVDDQQKVIHSDFDLQCLALFSMYNKEGIMELLVSHKAESSGSISSGIIAFDDQPQSSGIIPFEKPRIDYDVPDKIKEPLKSAHWLHLFKELNSCFREKYHAAAGYEYMVYRNEKLRIGARCANKNKEEKCDWHLYAVSVDGVDPNKKTKHIMESFTRDFGFDISRYYAYAACSRGFNFCRPVLFVDAAHLKSKYLGHMMAATGLTGNDGKKSSLLLMVWFHRRMKRTGNFLDNLKKVLSPLRPKLTFVSDRGIGLVTQIPIVFPEAFHGWCYWHMECNINTCLPKSCKVYNKYVLGLFKKCAYASTHKEFSENWDKLRKVQNQKLQDYLSRAPLDKWASFFFKGRRYGRLCSNIAESFNGSVVEEREKPIAIMVDEIRVKLMDQMCKRREDSANLMK
ncbi:hypothetical protein C5167_020995 [Papaver somniferum]|uniref:MULE transposase domain-containing protein n=1 Tax=Papaver somniferum TaxID=3469 RepID=A0A4Y7IUM0_PAPSO|nr:hypothetical protein C5167_020995 [Papaver somniferum]